MSAKILRRATAGVGGRSRRQMKAQGVAIVAAYVASATFQGALHYDGAGNWIVYGVWPAAAPLVIVGATVAGIASANETGDVGQDSRPSRPASPRRSRAPSVHGRSRAPACSS